MNDSEILNRNRSPQITNQFIELVWFALVGIVSLVGAMWATGFRPGNLENPVTSSDLLGSYMMAKIVSTQDSLFGYYKLLGYPYGQDWSLQPFTNLLGIAELKVLSWVGLEPIEMVHWVLLLGFVFAGISAFWVLRVIGTNRFVASLLALSFTLLPWHVFRFVHLWLANYWIIPIGILWVLIISRSLLIDRNKFLKRFQILIGVLIGLLIGIQDSYYAVFLLVIGLFGLVFNFPQKRTEISRRFQLLIFAAPVVSLGATILLVQNVFVQSQHLYSPVVRNVGEQFSNGGNFSSLYLPTWGMLADNPFFVKLSQVIQNPSLPIAVNAEGIAVFSLIVAIASIVTSLYVLLYLFQPRNRISSDVLGLRDNLSVLLGAYVVSVAFFVTTGLGLYVGVLISPQIRAWGRMAPIIAYISICVLAVIITRLLEEISVSKKKQLLKKIAIYGVLTTLVILSQGPAGASIQNPTIKTELANYSQSAEANLEDGCPIFNFPPVAFPEGGLLDTKPKGDVYSDILPYLYVNNHPFSFGAIKGQLGGLWYERISNHPIEAAIQAKTLGFCALQFDASKVDNPEEEYAQLQSILGSPIADANDEWFLFSLANAPVLEEFNNLLDSPEFWATNGFYLYEFENKQRFWWSGASKLSEGVLGNPANYPQEIQATFKIEIPPCLENQSIFISSADDKFQPFELRVGKEGAEFALKLALSPKEISQIHFKASHSCSTPSDIRVFTFRLFSPEIVATKK